MKQIKRHQTKYAIGCAVALLLGSVGTLTGFAAEPDPAPVAFVTIADGAGQLALAQAAVTVTDTDADGVLTLRDALYAAHEQSFPCGAAAGFGSATTEFGISLTRLWGAEAGSGFGYCHNNQFANSLSDPIAAGDTLCAYVYTDVIGWSDEYCYFDVTALDGDTADTFTLTLRGLTFDENWSPITEPIADAYLTFNGARSAYRTNAEGQVTFSLPADATIVLSAVSDTQVLVPPVCLATQTVAQDTTTEPTSTAPQSTTTTTASSETATTTAAPATAAGDSAPICAMLLLLGLTAMGTSLRKRCTRSVS